MFEYKAPDERLRHVLAGVGLTPTQASLYEVLVQRGALSATRLSFLASVPRTLSYKILTELEELGLVVKTDQPGKVARFSAAHPTKLRELADKRLLLAQESKNNLEVSLAGLIADFQTTMGEPQTRVLEGKKGLVEVYNDQLALKLPVKLLVSVQETPGLRALREEHMQKMAQNNINFVTSPSPFPLQVCTYGGKLALTSFENSLVTHLIDFGY